MSDSLSEKDSSFKIQYRSSRREVWDWYWWIWRQPKGLWRYHVGIAVVGFTLILLGRAKSDGITAADLAWAAAASFILVAWFPFWPLLRFKPQLRELEMDAAGIRSVIGKRRGDRRWEEIAAIHDRNGAIFIVGNNMNAFIVPQRAFATEAARASFLESARRWHGQIGPGAPPGPRDPWAVGPFGRRYRSSE